MDANGQGPTENTGSTSGYDTNVVKMPYDELNNVMIPDISLPELLFQAIDMNYDVIKDRVWVGNVDSGASYKFKDIKPIARRIASALTRLGFKKGDVLYMVTYESAFIYIVNIGVWLCGGSVRSCYQRERNDVYVEQMKEVSARFILCDHKTSAVVKGASEQLGWDVNLLSIGGQVEGTLALEELIKNEDCSAFPDDLIINPKEDTLVIINTSGSTGASKGVRHTHFNYVYSLTNRGLLKKIQGIAGASMLAAVGNFFSSLYFLSLSSLIRGSTFYCASTFDLKLLIQDLPKYKPDCLFLHPYAVHAFVQSDEIEKYDMNFIKIVFSGGSVLNYATAKALETKLPHAKLTLVYGISEANKVAGTDICPPTKKPNADNRVAGIKFKTLQGDTYLTCGHLDPLVEAKIVDPVSGCSLGRNVKGSLLIKTHCFMKGYIKEGVDEDASAVLDKDGWFHTGDVAFFDEDDFLYVVDRSRFTFKYHMHWVSPTELEDIILEHPAVVSAIVVGVPDPVTTSLAKAFVVLKPGQKLSEEDIKSHVAGKTEDYKHLHGGVVFVDSLPTTAGGKINRNALLKRAIAEMGSTP
ncbi:uncharacterized protein [Hetaerina americana]|uniref:uncharacterized protein n=1 Tax=Hetaerina americana TaxID=62018 RepID=UPI003A7F53EF